MASLTLDWLHLIILLGAIQGGFLAGALLATKRNRSANRLLAAAMIAFSIGLATNAYYAAGLEARYPHFFGIAYPMPFLYGPLTYLYTLAAADRDYRLHKADLLHFVPFVVTVLLGLPLYLLSGAEKMAALQQIRAGNGPAFLGITDPLKYVSGIAYAAATMLFLRTHHERVKDTYSSTERVNLRWLLWLGAAAAAIWILATLLGAGDSLGLVHIANSDDYVSLCVAALVYAIGYMGLRQPEVFRYDTREHRVPNIVPPIAPLTQEAVDTETARYERSGLTEATAQRLKATLLTVMDTDRPWKNAELTLSDLAALLKTTPHKVSEVLNSQVGETFYDFVNGYRVREVQRRIAAGDARALKLLSIAMDAGFASKSTFNQAFKKVTGKTPTDFREKVGA